VARGLERLLELRLGRRHVLALPRLARLAHVLAPSLQHRRIVLGVVELGRRREPLVDAGDGDGGRLGERAAARVHERRGGSASRDPSR